MPKVKTENVITYVETNIGTFHKKRLQSIQELKLNHILKRKNPYLFKAKNILTAQDLVKNLLDAYLSSQEETIFGDFLEGLAIFINQKVYGGQKSSSEGIDLEFSKENVRYIVTIKSGPNWGNSSQIGRMIDNFNKAKRIRRTSNSNTLNIVAVNGCCYGKDNQPDKGEYFKYCGQNFWEFISGDNNLFVDIVEPLGHQARQKNEEFIIAYAQIINLFTQEFNETFCSSGLINWEKLVKFNSSNEA
ncbi:MAG: cytosolic protein [Candidatus Moraniibacteriota bacterium]|nr:MAG: cytosolic protein [Candidatus Moranbacteria bacterium]